MRKVMLIVALALFGGGVALAANPASATEGPQKPVCNTAWYVNGDEGNLKPKQEKEGLFFDNASLIHHAASGLFADAKDDGAFVAKYVHGVKPLFKTETLAPYSTVNKTAVGLYWSSKISSGPGSQGEPVTLAVLKTTAPYTATTTLLSFGVGYANDQGNSALVTMVKYAGHWYSLSCYPPKPTHTVTPNPTKTTTSPTASPTASPSSSTSPVATHVPSTPPITGRGASLPVTGPSGFAAILATAGALMAGGVLVFLIARRRKNRFVA